MDVDPSVNLEHTELDQSPGPKILEAPSLIAAIDQQTHILQKDCRRIAPEPSRKPLSKKVEEFFRLKPPTFDHAKNSIEAVDWLHGIKRRLELV